MHVRTVLLALALLSLPCEGALTDVFSTTGTASVAAKVVVDGKTTKFAFTDKSATLNYYSLRAAMPYRYPNLSSITGTGVGFYFSKYITRSGGNISGTYTVTYYKSATLYEHFSTKFTGKVTPSGKQLKATVNFFGKAVDGSKDYVKGTITFAGPKPQ